MIQIGQEESGAWKQQKSPNLSVNISGKCLSLFEKYELWVWYWLICKQNLIKLRFHSIAYIYS